MGYFDGFTANLFRNTSDGRRVYAPFGKLGSVYLVSDEAAIRISTAVKHLYQAMLAAIIGTQLLLGWRWNVFLVGPLAICGSVILLRQLTRGLPIAPESVTDLPKVSPMEMLQRQGDATGRPVTKRMLVIVLLLTAGGVGMIVSGNPLGWFVAGCFGLCTVVFIVQLRRRH